MAKTLSVNKKTTALAAWEEQLAADAKDAAASEVMSGRFLSNRAAQWSYGGTPLKNPLNVIVMDVIHENAWYGADWDPDAPASPDCFALAREEKELAPHPQCAKPQHPTCKGCPKNEFGTADKGKGKACRNTRRLALILPEQLNDAAKAEVVYWRPPVTSVRKWSEYVHALKSVMNRPPYAVITKMTVATDPKTQVAVTFEPAEQIDMAKHFDALREKRDEIRTAIMFPYQGTASTDKVEEQKPARKVKYK